MRYTLVISILAIAFVACKKDKYTSAPQISFKSISPQYWDAANTNPYDGPFLTIHLTDAEGDFGPLTSKDTSYVYIKNISVAPYKTDSLKFPQLTNLDTRNLKADVSVMIRSVLANSGRPTPHVDTLYFEIYVKDFAKNKSNVITTPKPVYYLVN